MGRGEGADLKTYRFDGLHPLERLELPPRRPRHIRDSQLPRGRPDIQ
jgi:hypothetical protein